MFNVQLITPEEREDLKEQGGDLWELVKWLEEIIHRIENDGDVIILNTGTEGHGKSVFSYHLAHMLDPTFHAKDRWANGAKELMQKSLNAGRGKCIVADEIAEGGNARKSMTIPNTALQEFFWIGRKLNMILIINCPNRRWADSYMRDHRHAYWTHVVRPTWRQPPKVLIHDKNHSPYSDNNYEPLRLKLDYPDATGDEYEKTTYIQRKRVEYRVQKLVHQIEEWEKERGLI